MTRRVAVWWLLAPGLAMANEVVWVDAGGAGQTTSLQEGIDLAGDGATVLVSPGLYAECVTAVGRNLRVVGLGGADETLLVCEEGDALSWSDGSLELGHLTLRAGGAGAGLTLFRADAVATDLRLRGGARGVVAAFGLVVLDRLDVASEIGLVLDGAVATVRLSTPTPGRRVEVRCGPRACWGVRWAPWTWRVSGTWSADTCATATPARPWRRGMSPEMACLT